MLLICFRFSGFPLLSSLVSRAFFPVLCFRLSVCFLSPHPVSLPQLLDRCLPFAFAFGTFRDLSGFFRPLVTASGYSALPFFSLLPDFPRLGSLGACFTPSVSPVAMRFFRFWYSAYCNSVLRFSVSPHSCYTVSDLSFQFRPFPLVNTLGSGYLAFQIHPEN